MTRRALWLTLILLLPAAPARADWWIKGFGGFSFARDSGIVDLDMTNAGHPLIVGAGAGRTLGVLQVETEVALSPGFFRGEPDLLETGSVTTFTGNVAWTVPKSSSRISGYVTGGGGLARIAIDDRLGAFSSTSNKFVANAGGGVDIRTTSRLDAFADLRYFRTTESEPSVLSFGSEYLSYARFTAGARWRF